MVSTALDPTDPRVLATVDLLSKTPLGLLSVPKAMLAEGFTLKDSKSKAKQMWIRRRLNGVAGNISNVLVDGPSVDEKVDENAAESVNDPRVKKAVRLLGKTTGLTVRKAMRAEGFTREDSLDASKQMWIRRRLGKKGYEKGGIATTEEQQDEDEGRAGMYYAVRVGYASVPSLTDEDDGVVDIRLCIRRLYDVKINSAIFLHWEDARRFVETVPRDADLKAEYAAFKSFEDAEEYLMEEERVAVNASVAADVAEAEVDVGGIVQSVKKTPGASGKKRQATDATAHISKRKKTTTGGHPVEECTKDELIDRWVQRRVPKDGGASEKKMQATATANINKRKNTEPKQSTVKAAAVSVVPLKSTAQKEIPKSKLSSWDKSYNKLVEYKDAVGSIEVPDIKEISNLATKSERKRLGEWKMLRSWCNSQSHRLRLWSQGYTDAETYHWSQGQAGANRLKAEKMEKLRAVGFPMPPSYDEMYQKLAAHKAVSGALDVTKEDDEELFAWKEAQKDMFSEHAKGRHVSLSEDQIQNLKALGFEYGRVANGHPGVVDTGLVEKKWDATLDALVKYKEERGSFSFVKNPTSKPVRSLKHWIEMQRNEYRKILEGKESTLTARRLQRLAGIKGLDMNPRVAYTWEQRMQQMRDFVAEHGHAQPKRHDFLGPFVSNIRTFYREKEEGKTNSLTDERVNDLLEIGFVFNTGKRRTQMRGTTYKSWEDRFQELLAFKEEHGHTSATKKKHGYVGTWVRDQRCAYQLMKKGKRTQMTPEKALRLSEIGFVFDASAKS